MPKAKKFNEEIVVVVSWRFSPHPLPLSQWERGVICKTPVIT
jgi:hypothetical protein